MGRLVRGLRSSFLYKKGDTDAVEGLFAVDAEDDKGAVAVFVIVLCDCFILVLSGSVPYLHLDFKVIDFSYLVHEVDSNGHHVIVNKFTL